MTSLSLLRITGSLILTAVLCCAQSRPNPQGDPSKDDQEKDARQLPVLLQQVTVTATRTSEQIENIPQFVTVLKPESIEQRQARTPNMMLREEPGIWTPQEAQQGSVIIRGLIGNRVLYLWNGVRINNGAIISGPNQFFNQVPTGAVERMEVVQGPGAVQYGSDAIGGVVNIITRPAQVSTGSINMGGEFTTAFGTVDNEKTGLTSGWLARKHFGLQAGFTGQGTGAYSTPDFGRQAAGFNNLGGYSSFVWRPSAKHAVSVDFLHDRRSDIAYYAQSKLNTSLIPRIFGPFEQRGMVRLAHTATNICSFCSELRTYFYYEYYDAARQQLVESAPTFARTDTATSQRVMGGGVQNTSVVRHLEFTYGGDYRAEDLNSDRQLITTTKATGAVVTTIPNGNVPIGNYNVFDAFGIGTLHVSRRLRLSAGGRLESIHMLSFPRPQDALTPFTVDDLKFDKRWNALTWSTGAVFGLTDSWSIAANASAGFRAPSFSDTLSTGVPVFASGVASVPSPKVGPERNITYEIGPRYASRRFNLMLTAYTNQLTDLVTSAPSGTINIPGVGVVIAQQNFNSATGYIRGVEGAMAWRVAGPWIWFANSTFTRGMDTTRNVRLRFIPPVFGTSGLRYSRANSRWWGEAALYMADRLRSHAPQDETDGGFSRDPGFGSPSATNPAFRPGYQMPGFATVTLRGSVDILRSDRRTISFYANLNNAMNHGYRDAYAQQQLEAPGVGLVGGVRMRFSK